MFETTAVEARSHKRSTLSVLMLPVSVTIHALAFSGAMFYSIWSIEMPTSAPNQMHAIPYTPSVPLPSGGGEPPRSIARPAQQQAAPAQQIAAPDIIPIEPIGQLPPEAEIIDPTANTVGTGSGSNGVVEGEGTGRGNEPGIGDGVGEGTGNGISVASSGPLVPGGDVKSPVIIAKPEPRYPETLRATRHKGFAVVECVIGTDGMPRAIELRSTNHALFGASAVEAVSKWRFRPGTLNGRAVETILQLRVEFLLR